MQFILEWIINLKIYTNFCLYTKNLSVILVVSLSKKERRYYGNY